MPHKIIDEKDIYKVIAKNLKKHRTEKRITQKELAKKTGYSYAYIRRIEGPNCTKNFSILTVYKISLALDIDIGSLFEDTDI